MTITTHPTNPQTTGTVTKVLFFVALLLVSIALFVPLYPGMPKGDLDSSWMYGMNEAVQKGLEFGRDVLFTFGPYSSVATWMYNPATYGLMVLGSVVLTASFFFVVYQQFKDSRLEVKVLLLLLLSTDLMVRDAAFFFIIILVGVAVWKWASSLNEEKQVNPFSASYVVALFVPFGLLPLVKGSALVGCVAITILSAAAFAMRGAWMLAVAALLAPILSMIIFWSISGQALGGLPNYLLGLHPIIEGYSAAMSITGNHLHIYFYVLVAIAIVGVLFVVTGGTSIEKTVLALMFMCILFLGFKAGFVRHDSHSLISAATLAAVTLLMVTLNSTLLSRLTLVPVGAAFLFINAPYLSGISWQWSKQGNSEHALSWEDRVPKLFDREWLDGQYELANAALRSERPIPPLDGTVDIYALDHSYLIASGNDWAPRPILQSYSAYTPELALSNRDYLLSKGRPDNVIFAMQTIDGRLPTLDDGVSWPELLVNYDLESMPGQYLHLFHRTQPTQAAQMESIFKATHRMGEEISVPKSEEMVFVKIEFEKSPVGRLINFLFKTTQLDLKVIRKSGRETTYRVVAGMTETGFLLSPLIETERELAKAFVDVGFVSYKEVDSIVIQPRGFQFLWENDFQVEFLNFSPPRRPEASEMIGVVAPQTSNFNRVVDAKSCETRLDLVNGSPLTDNRFQTSRALEVQGWLVASIELEDVPNEVYLVLSNDVTERQVIKTKRHDRPDVAEFFERPNLKDVGFSVLADISNLSGVQSMRLGYSREDTLFLCPGIEVEASFAQD